MTIHNGAFLTKGLLIAALMLFAIPSFATWVDGPHWVRANDDGGFFVLISTHGGEGGDYIDSVTMTGTDNCDETKVINHACELFVDHNEMVYDGFNSRVLEIGTNAWVHLTVLLCDGRELSIDVEVRPYDTVDTETGSLDSIKAQYR